MSLFQAAESDNRLFKLLEELESYLEKDDLQFLIHVLQQHPGQEMEILQELMSYTYDHIPVPMREFVESEEYLGMKGQVYPRLLDDLEELFDSKKYNEAVLTGGIGWGKSTFAEIALVRMVYEVSCLKNPQKMYGLADGSVIAFVNVSVNLAQARNVVFTGVKNKINNSHYFKTKVPYDANLKTEIRFPKNIWITPAASNESGVIGLNVFGGVLDEVNFMAIVENSKQAIDGGTYDQATQLHNAMIRRMKSRFLRKGKLPGILLSISSSKYPDDFTERRIKEAIENGEEDVFIRRYSQWATKPADRYSGRTFQVCLGDALNRPHIIENEEQLKEAKEKNLKIIDVPEEYYRDFKVDIDMAIRDIAGYPTLTIKPFITNREKIYEALARGERELGLRHPFSREVTTLQDGGALLVEYMWKQDFSKPHFVHADLALNGDGCGFAIAYIKGYREVVRRNSEGDLYKEVAPEIVVPFAIRIVAPPNGEVQIGDVRALIFELLSLGVNIRKVTFDQFQSADSIQQLQRRGIESENLSVDSKLDPYNAFKDALYEDRLYFYNYRPAIEEATRLEKNEKTNKVDHPPSGSKDVTDAIAGAVYHCVTYPMYNNVLPRHGQVHHAVEEKTPEQKAKDMVERYFDEFETNYYSPMGGLWDL